MKFLDRVVSLTFLTGCLSVAAFGATFNVNTTDDLQDATPGDGICATASANCSLRAAISEANALAGDDIINVPAGTYTQTLVAANEDLNAGGDWDVTSVIVFNGAGAATTILQANAAQNAATERVLNVRATGNATINGVSFRHGRFTGTMTTATRGAGIENLGTLVLNTSIVTLNNLNSTSGNPIGAGIHNGGPVLTLIETSVENNVNNRVSGGSAFGGGISSIVAAAITITNSSVSQNSSISVAGGFGFGAGMYLENLFNVNATNSSFSENIGSGTSGANGGGVRALSNIGAAQFTATECTFNNNSGQVGPARQGIGLQFFTTTSAAATQTINLNRVSVNGNTGLGPGVGINATVSTGGLMTLNFNNSTLSNNTGATNGGGMSISNTGGTVNSVGNFNFTNSTISGNTATGNGGGLFVEQPAAGAITTNLNFTTVAGNTANSDNAGTESGGGIFRGAAGTVNLKNSLIGDNSVGTGGSGPDISGTVTSQDYNHIEDLTGNTIGGTTTNNSTGDALLGVLANNGGSTFTHLPGAGSAALNAIPNGTNDCGTAVTTDQRGSVRPVGAGCDKGSVEAAAAAVPAYIAGRVLSSSGRPLRNVWVTISGGGLPSPIVVQTGSFGNYRFNGLLTGNTYLVEVSSNVKISFTPSSRSILVTGNLDNENFIADPE